MQISGTAGGASIRSPDSGEASGDKSDSSGENHSLVQSLTKLVKTQNQMVEAHTRAMSVQGLPPLKHYSGEGVQLCVDGFDRFIEQFEKHASLAGWSEEHCKYCLKLHLSKTAFQTYRLTPDSMRVSYSDSTQCT